MSLTDQQPPTPEEKGTPALQTASRIGTVGVIIAALYVGWTFYSRHLSDEQAARDLAERKQAEIKKQADLIFGRSENC